MASQSRIHADRANAAESRGPGMSEGKRRSSWNALRHGATGVRSVVLPLGGPQRFRELLDSYLADIQPNLLHDLVQIRWRLSHLALIEGAVIDHRMNAHCQDAARVFSRPGEPDRAGMAWFVEANNSRTLSLLNRYHARLDRAWRHALTTLQRLPSCRRAAEMRPGKIAPRASINSQTKPIFDARQDVLDPDPGSTSAPEELE